MMLLNGWELDVLEEATEGREADVLIPFGSSNGGPFIVFFFLLFFLFLSSFGLTQRASKLMNERQMLGVWDLVQCKDAAVWDGWVQKKGTGPGDGGEWGWGYK